MQRYGAVLVAVVAILSSVRAQPDTTAPAAEVEVSGLESADGAGAKQPAMEEAAEEPRSASIEEALPSTDAIRILVMRPLSVYGREEISNKWLLLLCEDYFYFRLGGVPGVEYVDPALLGELLPGYREYQKPLSNEMYLKAARNLSAPYALYVECLYTPLGSGGQLTVGQQIHIMAQCIRAEDGRGAATVSKQIPLKKLGETLDGFMAEMLDSIGVDASDRNAAFLDKPVLSTRKNPLRDIGEALESWSGLDDASWEKFVKKYRAVLNRNPDMTLGFYSGSKFCEAKGRYADAARFAHDLVNEYRERYPLAFLMAARNYSRAGECEAAQKIALDVQGMGRIQSLVDHEAAKCGLE